jgi:hypothetical protein
VSASVLAFEDRLDLIRSVCPHLFEGAHRDVVGRSAINILLRRGLR